MPQCVDCFFLNCHPAWGTTGRSPYIYMSSTADVRSLIWAWRISCHPLIHFTPPQQSPSPISPTPDLSSRTPSSDLLIDMSLNHSALSLVLVRLPPSPLPSSPLMSALLPVLLQSPSECRKATGVVRHDGVKSSLHRCARYVNRSRQDMIRPWDILLRYKHHMFTGYKMSV